MYREYMEEQVKLLDSGSNIDTLSDETSRIFATDWLNSLAKNMTDINDLSFNIRNKGDKIFLLFRFVDYQGSKCSGGIQINKHIIEIVDDITSIIINGQWALQALNTKFSEVQANGGNIITIKFKLGFNKYASIAYWDYSNIVIRLNESAVKLLIDKLKSSESSESLYRSIEEIHWPESIPEFINKISSSELSSILSINMDYESLSDALIDNMLSRKDISDILIKNKDTKGTQKLKSVEIVDQLGLFVAILILIIDYENSDVSVDILDNKVIDLENNRFVSDHSLYSRIEQKILDDTEDITKILK